jgi:hypothetical protein
MKANIVSIVIITLIIAGGAYWFFFMQPAPEKPLTATAPAAGVSDVQLAALVAQLQKITFDTSIFSDPTFETLVSLATPVTPEPQGRADPFAPF